MTRVLDLDAQRRVVVCRIQVNGEEHDVLPFSLADAERVAAAASVEDVVSALRTCVPTLSDATARSLTFEQAQLVITQAVGTLNATPNRGRLCS